MTIPSLEIDLDKECSKCSEEGVTKSGLCLKCIAQVYKNRTIGYQVIQQAQVEICAMLEEYAEDIDKAYIKADNDLTIPISIKLGPTRIAGEVELIVASNFVKDRIKYKIKVVVDSKQKKLPGF